jgi:hypothetical protein
MKGTFAALDFDYAIKLRRERVLSFRAQSRNLAVKLLIRQQDSSTALGMTQHTFNTTSKDYTPLLAACPSLCGFPIVSEDNLEFLSALPKALLSGAALRARQVALTSI